MKATSVDFSYDVESSLNYLETRADVNKKELGLIGHSEGAIIAPMVAARRKDVAFVVLWGCPAIGGAQTSTMQAEYAMRKLGVSDAALAAFNKFQMSVFDAIPGCKTITAFNDKVAALFTDWKKTQSPTTISALNMTDASVADVQKNYAKIYGVAWMRYFITYDPLPDLRKTNCPVLAVIGTKDTQVDAARNLPLIKATLTKSGNTDMQTVALPNLNHFLQTANTGDIDEGWPEYRNHCAYCFKNNWRLDKGARQIGSPVLM